MNEKKPNDIRRFLIISINYDKLATGLACVMYAAYLNRIPVLFAGPKAAEFGNVFSVSVFGESAAQVGCLREYNDKYRNSIVSCKNNVITFKNILHDKWLNSVVDILNSSDKYFYFTTPFYEDLSVEPRSSLNYYIPIFTDLLIKHGAKECKYEGGVASSKYERPEFKKAAAGVYSSLLKEMQLTPYVKNIYKKVISDAIQLKNDYDMNGLLMIMMLSAAFMLGKTDIAVKYVEDHVDNSRIKELIYDFFGEEE